MSPETLGFLINVSRLFYKRCVFIYIHKTVNKFIFNIIIYTLKIRYIGIVCILTSCDARLRRASCQSRLYPLDLPHSLNLLPSSTSNHYPNKIWLSLVQRARIFFFASHPFWVVIFKNYILYNFASNGIFRSVNSLGVIFK